ELEANAGLAPVRRDDAETNAEEPRRNSRAAVEVREAQMYDHEDLLKEIFQVGVSRAEALQRRPHEIAMAGMHGCNVGCVFERCHGRRPSSEIGRAAATCRHALNLGKRGHHLTLTTRGIALSRSAHPELSIFSS